MSQSHRPYSSRSLDLAVGLAVFLAVGCRAVPVSVPADLCSPDGRVKAALSLAPSLALRISQDGVELVRSAGLGLAFVDAPSFGRELQVVACRAEASERPCEYGLGARSGSVDRHRSLVVVLREREAPKRTAELHLRVHDDGVAYRWRFVDWPGTRDVRVEGEVAEHTLAGDPRAFPLYRDHFRTSHEGPYTEGRTSALETGRLIDLPLLFARDDGRCVAFTEADVRDFPHTYLARASGSGPGLVPRLSPRLDDPLAAAHCTLPFQTPWRVWLVGDSIAPLLESDLPLFLCEPSRIADASWIVPGKQTWHWWNGTVVGHEGRGGMDFDTMRAYVDFCARTGIRYHAVNGQDVPWYQQSRQSVLPSPDADVLAPRPELRWEDLRRHAQEQGVSLRLWAHWQPLHARLEEAFAQYERWGVSGLMVDFLDRDDQEMVRFCERVLEVAARHRLTIQFHGSFKPTGLQRTWPNLMNHEGSANLEVLKWGAGCDPAHDLIVPFTRGLAGPLDYHLGGFRAVHRAEFQAREIRPVVFGTRARALANYVVLSNPLPMVADYPAACEAAAGFDFVVDVPTVWDESRVLSAAIGEHLVWARRAGERWYVGAIGDWTPREFELSLAFLGPGSFELRLFADSPAPDADPNEVVETRQQVTAADSLRLALAAGGGAAVVMAPRR